MLALVSEFNCFLRSRCSTEMWCPHDIGRDNWDWVGPPAWVRACFNSPEWGGGSSPVKTEPPQIVLLLLLCCCVVCCVLWLWLWCVVVCCGCGCCCGVVWCCAECCVCCVFLCCVLCAVCCVLCVVCCFTVSLFHCFTPLNACDVTTQLAPDAPSPGRNNIKEDRTTSCATLTTHQTPRRTCTTESPNCLGAVTA